MIRTVFLISKRTDNMQVRKERFINVAIYNPCMLKSTNSQWPQSDPRDDPTRMSVWQPQCESSAHQNLQGRGLVPQCMHTRQWPTENSISRSHSHAQEKSQRWQARERYLRCSKQDRAGHLEQNKVSPLALLVCLGPTQQNIQFWALQQKGNLCQVSLLSTSWGLFCLYSTFSFRKYVFHLMVPNYCRLFSLVCFGGTLWQICGDSLGTETVLIWTPDLSIYLLFFCEVYTKPRVSVVAPALAAFSISSEDYHLLNILTSNNQRVMEAAATYISVALKNCAKVLICLG